MNSLAEFTNLENIHIPQRESANNILKKFQNPELNNQNNVEQTLTSLADFENLISKEQTIDDLETLDSVPNPFIP